MTKDRFVYHWYEEPYHSIVDIDKSKLKDLFPNLEDNFFFLRYKSKKVRIGNLKKFCDFVNISYSNLERKNTVKINNMKFPIKLNVPEFIILATATTNEGHLETGKYLFEYYNKDVALHKLIDKCIFKVFSIKILKPKQKGSVLRSYCYGIVPRALRKVGVSIGDKALSNLDLSKIIKNNGFDFWKIHIRQTLLEEGTTYLFIKNRKYVSLFLQYGRSIDITDKIPSKFKDEIKNSPIFIGQLPNNIKKIIWNNPPSILVSEKNIVSNFGIISHLKPINLYKISKCSRIRSHWRLEIWDSKSVELALINFMFSKYFDKENYPIKFQESLEKFIIWKKYKGKKLVENQINEINEIVEKWNKIKAGMLTNSPSSVLTASV